MEQEIERISAEIEDLESLESLTDSEIEEINYLERRLKKLLTKKN